MTSLGRCAWPRGAMVALAVGGAVIALLGTQGVAGAARRPDEAELKVALQVEGGCGRFADALPPVVIASQTQPGDVVGDVSICLANRGTVAAPVRMRVEALVDLDTACTGDEADLAQSDTATWGYARLHARRLIAVPDTRCGSAPPARASGVAGLRR